MTDAIGGILTQHIPQSNYNIEQMLKSVIMKNGKVKSCGTCLVTRIIGSSFDRKD